MNFKKLLFSLLILFTTLATGCSKDVILEGDSSIQHVFFDEDTSNLLNYNFKISDLNNIDETLINQKYLYSTIPDNKYVAVVIFNSENASMNQYLVKKDESVDLTLPKDSSFILSLHANRTIAYRWNIKNSLNSGLIPFKDHTWLKIPLPKSAEVTYGDNYDRQNFYFKPTKSGNEKIVMRYEHQYKHRNEFFEITFNIKIE